MVKRTVIESGVIRVDASGRRQYSTEIKRRLAQLALEWGASVVGIALAHRINANQLCSVSVYFWPFLSLFNPPRRPTADTYRSVKLQSVKTGSKTLPAFPSPNPDPLDPKNLRFNSFRSGNLKTGSGVVSAPRRREDHQPPEGVVTALAEKTEFVATPMPAFAPLRGIP